MARKTTTQTPYKENTEVSIDGCSEPKKNEKTELNQNLGCNTTEDKPEVLPEEIINKGNEDTQELVGEVEEIKKEMDTSQQSDNEMNLSNDVKPEQTPDAYAGTYGGSDQPEDDNPILNTPRSPHRPSSPTNNNRKENNSSPYTPYTPDPEGVKSTGMPIQLATAPWTQVEETDIRRILNGKSSEDIANDAYLANYRLLKQIEKWKEEHPEYNIELEESEADFILNIPKTDGVVTDHKLKSGKFLRSCSAAGGVLYLSPGIWNLVANERCMLCIFRGADNGRVANEFKLIRSYNELIEFIGMDDLILKITGEHRVKIVEFLYKNINFKVTKGTIYSLIRVSESASITPLCAPLPSTYTEQEDEDSKFY